MEGQDRLWRNDDLPTGCCSRASQADSGADAGANRCACSATGNCANQGSERAGADCAPHRSGSFILTICRPDLRLQGIDLASQREAVNLQRQLSLPLERASPLSAYNLSAYRRATRNRNLAPQLLCP